MTHLFRRIFRAGAAMAALAVLLLVACAAGAQTAATFKSNGDLISGWYWLRDPGLSHYAEYTFPTPPAHGDIILDITALATDRMNGGPGVNAHFNLLVGFPGAGNMGGVFHRSGVTLMNVGTDANGYMNHGQIRLHRADLDKVMAANGQLFVRIVRESDRDPHVAFRADSVTIFDGSTGGLPPGGGWPPGGGLPPDGTLLGDGHLGGGLTGGGTSGGGTIVIEGELTGGGITGDGTQGELYGCPGGCLGADFASIGQCCLDRPCLGVSADGFRSTGFGGMEGWFWLRAPTVGQTAEFLFEHPPTGADLVLDIAVLAQNRPGMTPKDTVHVNLTLGYPGSGSLGGQIGPLIVELPNLWMGPDEDIWRARALVVIPRELAAAAIPAVGGLFLTFDRIDAFEPDIGFTAASVLLSPAQAVTR